MNIDWKCAGCGVPSPGRVRVCDCATNVVSQEEDNKIARTAWKRPAQAQEIYERCHALIGRLFEKPKIKGFETRDIDLIKAALKKYSEEYAP